MARSTEVRRLTRQLAAARAPVSEECKRLIALIRQRCPGLIPPDPLPSGKEGPEIPLKRDEVQRLVSTAAVAGGPPTVLWSQNDSELIVIAAKVEVVLAGGLFLIRIPVSCAEIRAATVEVAFAVGDEEQPAGMLCATEERPRGPAAIVDVWQDALIAYAWDILLTVSAAVAAETGTDEDGIGLIPTALSVNADGLRLKTMARHGFDRVLQ